MSVYQAITLTLTHPETKEVYTIQAFGLGGIDAPIFAELFASDYKVSDVASGFTISQPVDLPDLTGFPGFTEFISALEAEE